MSSNTTSTVTEDSTTEGIPVMTEGTLSAASQDAVSSSNLSSVHFSSQSSGSSSQGLSSQENTLQCSETMLSSTPSDNSQPPSQQETQLAGATSSKAETPSQGTSRNDIRPQIDDSDATSASPTATHFTSQANLAEKAKGLPSNGIHYSPGLSATSNLSQLAELAANKSALNQTIITTTQPTIQPLPSHILGNQSRFVIPSQNVPSTMGIQQPSIFGAYPPGHLVHMQGQYQGFPPAPPQVPPPFVKGSIIQLASGDLKRVEDLSTDDFIQSTRLCSDLKLETSTVVKIDDGSDAGSAHITFTINSSKAQVILNCPVEHPFFVYGQGWTSSQPDQSLGKYSLNCQSLKVGDVCIFLSPSNPAVIPAGIATSSGISNQVSSGNATLTQSLPGMISSPMKPSATNASSLVGSSLPVSYAQTLAGIGALPGNLPVVVTSSLPPGVPAIYSGQLQPGQNISQGKPTSQSGPENLSSALNITRSLPAQPTQGAAYGSDTKLSDSPQPTAAVPAGFQLSGTSLPSYYQPLTGAFMTTMPPGQTFMQGTVMPQGPVGNGLLVAAVGFVPGRHPAPFVQPGMLYGGPPVEMTPKGSDCKPDEYPHKGRPASQADLPQPEAKRAKSGEMEVK